MDLIIFHGETLFSNRINNNNAMKKLTTDSCNTTSTQIYLEDYTRHNTIWSVIEL